MEKIVFLDRESLVANIRRPTFPHRWEEYAATGSDEIAAHLQDAIIAISNKVQPFGMQVLFAEHKGAREIREGYTAFKTVIRDSDVLTLHLPLKKQICHLISTAEFENMQLAAPC